MPKPGPGSVVPEKRKSGEPAPKLEPAKPVVEAGDGQVSQSQPEEKLPVPVPAKSSPAKR